MAENDPLSENGCGLLWETMAFIDPDEVRIAFEKLILKRIAGEVPPSKLRRGRSELADEDAVFRKNYRNHDMIPIVLNVQRKGEYRISSEGRDMLDHLSNYTTKSEEIMRGKNLRGTGPLLRRPRYSGVSARSNTNLVLLVYLFKNEMTPKHGGKACKLEIKWIPKRYFDCGAYSIEEFEGFESLVLHDEELENQNPGSNMSQRQTDEEKVLAMLSSLLHNAQLTAEDRVKYLRIIAPPSSFQEGSSREVFAQLAKNCIALGNLSQLSSETAKRSGKTHHSARGDSARLRGWYKRGEDAD